VALWHCDTAGQLIVFFNTCLFCIPTSSTLPPTLPPPARSQVNTLYALHEIPVLVRAGAIITTLPSVVGDTIGVASRQYTSLIHTIYPGAKQGSSVVYEDDGSTTRYAAAPSTPSTTSAIKLSFTDDLIKSIT